MARDRTNYENSPANYEVLIHLVSFSSNVAEAVKDVGGNDTLDDGARGAGKFAEFFEKQEHAQHVGRQLGWRGVPGRRKKYNVKIHCNLFGQSVFV
jgi:hypothetical protein